MKIDNVGILTWHNHGNYGGSLQAYSLMHTIKSLGFSVKIINFQNNENGKRLKLLQRKLKYWIGSLFDLFGIDARCRYCFSFIKFEIDYLEETKMVVNRDELKDIAKSFNCIICGSDQIWAPNVFNPIFMLDFIESKDIRKVSYAASIGLSYLPLNLKSVYSSLLDDFNYISVREEEGCDLLKKECGISSELVLDPTFLPAIEVFQNIEKPLCVNSPFAFCYFLNSNNDYEITVNEYCKNRGYSVIGVSKKRTDNSWMKVFPYIGPCEFLWLIEHAEVIFTDSYHGTIFSLRFHKRFFTFERFNIDDPINQNSRIYQLDAYFGLKNRLLTEGSCIKNEIKELDYDEFERRLSKLRAQSLRYIMESLS